MDFTHKHGIQIKNTVSFPKMAHGCEFLPLRPHAHLVFIWFMKSKQWGLSAYVALNHRPYHSNLSQCRSFMRMPHYFRMGKRTLKRILQGSLSPGTSLPVPKHHLCLVPQTMNHSQVC